MPRLMVVKSSLRLCANLANPLFGTGWRNRTSQLLPAFLCYRFRRTVLVHPAGFSYLLPSHISHTSFPSYPRISNRGHKMLGGSFVHGVLVAP
ncbi:hypothetical protein VPHD239_0119 [Vibrio phage D239]